MPRYEVIEIRAYKAGYLIDAESEEDAKAGVGEIIAESETDSWGESTESVEEVDANQDEVGRL